MRSRRKRVRLALLAAVAVVATMAGVLAHGTNLFRRFELYTVDARFSLRGHHPTPKGVVVVAVDDSTFNVLYKDQWPYRRAWHGIVIRNLKRAGARVIVYDIQFTEPSRFGPGDDQKLLQDVYDAGNVVLGTSEIGAGGHTRIFGGDVAVHAAHGTPASAQYDLDPGGVIRRIPYETDGLRTMPVVAYERAFGRAPSRAGFRRHGAWIDFNGGPGSIRTVPFWSVYENKAPASLFRGKIVVVGASATSLQDVHPTSTTGSGEMSGPEIQAHAIDTLERGVPLRSAPGWVDIALIVLLALIAPLPALRLSFMWAAVAALVGNAAFLAGAQLAFNSGRIVTVVYPLTSAVISTFGALSVQYFTEVRERRRTRAAFARFVPAAVVDRVLEQAEDGLRLGGEEVLGTVLFSDIRGFTTFSENNPAAEVLEILNHYLEEMTAAIMGHGGTLVAYLGDGIIAVFGAPLEQPDHADRALAAAQEMLGTRLESVNEWLRGRGLEQGFQMGIGINSGIFMAGNVGSHQRLEYTVIGDTINTAARMEGLTKGSGHQMFIAESTRFMLLREPPPLEYVGEWEIRGRAGKMKIWAPQRADAPPAPPAEQDADARRARRQSSSVYEIQAEAELDDLKAESP